MSVVANVEGSIAAVTTRAAEAAAVSQAGPRGLSLLAALDPERRGAFVLTQLLGFSYSETAEICGVAVGTIRSRVARAPYRAGAGVEGGVDRRGFRVLGHVEGSNSGEVVTGRSYVDGMVTIDDVRELVSDLPRSYEALVRDRVKFRVGRIVYLAFSRDETRMGFGFPKEEREALVASDPDKFLMPSKSDMRYNWAVVRLDAIGIDEARELVLDAWRMCVPKRLAQEHLGA